MPSFARNSQFFTTALAACSDHTTAVCSTHTLAEAMLVAALAF